MVSRELPPRGGGIGSYTDKTARALARLGHEVHVLTEGEAARDVLRDGVCIHHLRRSALRPRVLGRALSVHAALRRLGPFDVVQACEWDAEAWLYALRPQGPLVTRLATPHYLVERLNQRGSAARRQGLCRALEHLQVRRSRLVISPSRALADEVSRTWRIDRSSIRIVPTGASRPSLGAAAPEPALKDTRYLLYFGRLEVRKGVDVLIDALPAILGAQPDTLAVLVGEDVGLHGRPAEAYARERCSGLEGRIRFLPRLPHERLFPIVAAATVVILPSRWENLANAALEAMTLGRPVVATTGSGFAEIIQDGVDGVLVPPGDEHALAQAVLRLLREPAVREAIGTNAKRRAGALDIDACAVALVEAWTTCLSRQAAKAGRPRGSRT